MYTTHVFNRAFEFFSIVSSSRFDKKLPNILAKTLQNGTWSPVIVIVDIHFGVLSPHNQASMLGHPGRDVVVVVPFRHF